MKIKEKFRSVLMLTFGAALATQVQAANVVIANNNFALGTTNNFTDWTRYNTSNAFQENGGGNAGPSGTAVAFNFTGGVFQVTTATIAAGDTYTLTFRAKQISGPFRTLDVGFFENNGGNLGSQLNVQNITLTNGSLTNGFADYSSTFTASASSANNLIISIRGGENQDYFSSIDGVFLDQTPAQIPEPSSLLMAGLVGTATLLVRRRK